MCDKICERCYNKNNGVSAVQVNYSTNGSITLPLCIKCKRIYKQLITKAVNKYHKL